MRIAMSVDNINYETELKNMNEGIGESIKPWKNRMKAIETGLIDDSVLAAPVGEKIAYIEMNEVRLKNRRDVENLIAFLENCKLGIEKGPQKFERVKNDYLSMDEDMLMEPPLARSYSSNDSVLTEDRKMSTNDV